MQYNWYGDDTLELTFWEWLMWIGIIVVILIVGRAATRDQCCLTNHLTEVDVVKVIDWDTIKARVRGDVYNIRLLDIDAPELSKLRYWYIESWSLESKKYLSKLLEGWVITALFSGEDIYWRKLAWLFNWNTPINNKMVIDWYAKDFTW